MRQARSERRAEAPWETDTQEMSPLDHRLAEQRADLLTLEELACEPELLGFASSLSGGPLHGVIFPQV